MRAKNVELAVGAFMLLGMACLGYLSVRFGRMEVLGSDGYEVVATFSNTGGIREGAAVVIAGVQIGRVKGIELVDYEGQVVMTIDPGVAIQEDAIAAIRTRGLIGEKYIEINPGGSDTMVGPGERIRDTQPAVNLEELISNFVFGKA